VGKVRATAYEIGDGCGCGAKGSEFGYLLSASRHGHVFAAGDAIDDITAVVA